ncbi:MAG TPA: amidohydrolase family protein [Gemmataceae bacterium]|nr:amidohydrolase family protein [Gemmataceae bacterium]
MTPTRREFCTSAAALAFGSRLAGAADRVPVVDTHLHCFAGTTDKRFFYHKDAPYMPEAPATPEHLLECMGGAGVDFAVVVHPEPYQDDHAYLEYCLHVGKGKLKGTCLFFAGRPDTIKRMAELAKKLPLVAARIHAYNPDRLPPFGKPELRDFWKAVGELGLAVQLHFEPRYAEGFESLIKEFKGVRVLVDHLGRPFQGTEKEHAVVLGWGKYEHVVMKISAVPDRKTYPHRDPQPVVKQLTEAFGADRLMYGGGFGAGATGESYRKERERIAGFLAHLSDAERAKVFGGTAEKLMGFQS